MSRTKKQALRQLEEEDRNEMRREWTKRLTCLQTRSSSKKTQKRQFEKEQERKVNNNKNTSLCTDNFQKDKKTCICLLFFKKRTMVKGNILTIYKNYIMCFGKKMKVVYDLVP